MSHFYGGIEGNRGPATRQGTTTSGIDGYVQSWMGRISASLTHDHGDVDQATIRIGAGPSNGRGGALAIHIDDLTTVVNALGCNDPKINAIRKRIYNEIVKLNEEAPAALERAERRRIRELRQEERERIRLDEEQDRIIRDLRPEEKARIVRLIGPVELDEEGNFESEYIASLKAKDAGNLRFDPVMHAVMISAMMPGFKRSWQRFDFDVTNGIWVFPFDPEDFGVSEELLKESGFGYRVTLRSIG